MFNEEYLDSLPNEPLLAVSEVVNKTVDHWDNLPPNQEHSEFETFIEAFAIVNALLDTSLI